MYSRRLHLNLFLSKSSAVNEVDEGASILILQLFLFFCELPHSAFFREVIWNQYLVVFVPSFLPFPFPEPSPVPVRSCSTNPPHPSPLMTQRSWQQSLWARGSFNLVETQPSFAQRYEAFLLLHNKSEWSYLLFMLSVYFINWSQSSSYDIYDIFMILYLARSNKSFLRSGMPLYMI